MHYMYKKNTVQQMIKDGWAFWVSQDFSCQMRDSYVLRGPNVEMMGSLPVVGHMALTTQKFMPYIYAFGARLQ